MLRMAPIVAGSLLLLATRTLAAEPDPARFISLNSYVFDVASPPRLPESLQAVGDGESELVLVKFPGPIRAEQLAALEQHARVFTYLPHFAYLVRMPSESRSGADSGALLRSLGASWSGAWHPGYKVSLGVREAQARGLGDVENIGVGNEASRVRLGDGAAGASR